jgi:hypothetical protein
VPSYHKEDLFMRSTGGIVTACAVIALLSPGFTTAQSLPPGLTAEAVQSATTPEQHRAIADAYAKEAENLRANALAHRHMDSRYNEPGYLSSKLGFPRHCRALTQTYEAAAKEADTLAKAHQAMADAAARKAK